MQGNDHGGRTFARQNLIGEGYFQDHVKVQFRRAMATNYPDAATRAGDSLHMSMR